MEENNIDLLMGTATFMVNMEASSNKATHKGMFKVKCVLSPLEYVNANALYRQLLGKDNPQFASDYVSRLCYAMSELKYRIIDAPDWFKNETTGINGSNVDDNILLYILEKAVECEGQYREMIDKKYKEARKEVRQSIDDGILSDKKEEVINDIDDEEDED